MEWKKKKPEQCKVVVALDAVVGKWKPLILLHLLTKGTLRYGEIRKLIPDITQRMLTLHLRQLEEQGIVKRVVYRQVPPRVEYSVTEHGKTLKPVLEAMHEWGMVHLSYLEKKNTQPKSVNEE